MKRFSVVLIDIIVNFELVNGGNLIRTCYYQTRRDYLIIKLVIVYRWYENLPLEWNKIIPLPFFKLITFHFSLAGKKTSISSFVCFSEKTRVSYYKLCEKNKSIKLQTLRWKQKYQIINIGVEKINYHVCQFNVVMNLKWTKFKAKYHSKI